MANKYGSDNIEYSKNFSNDPKFKNILDNNSIESKVTITQVHKNINSLAGVLEKSQRDAHKQFKSLSSSISSTAKDQEKIVKKFQMKELSSDKQVKQVEKSVQQILGKLGYTIDVLGKSSKQILLDTAKTTKRTLQEYGQALSSEFAVNKTNFLAMSLSKASPIFGYFAGKFMETSVFKNFAQKIKEKLGMAVTFVANKMKDLWTRGKERTTDWWNKRKQSKEDGKKLPKMASGGFVKKEGAAYIHSAEVVAPAKQISKLIENGMKPMTIRMDKILKVFKWMAIGKAAHFVYKIWKRNKFSTFLSKSKDPQGKLAEDFSTFFTMSMQKLDDIVTSMKDSDKLKKVKANGGSEFKNGFMEEVKNPAKYARKVKNFFKKDEESKNKQETYLKKIKNATEGTESKLGITGKSVNKGLSSIGTLLMVGFGFIKNLITHPFKTLGPLLKLGGSGLGKLLRYGAGGAWGAAKMGGRGVRGATKWGGRNVKKFIGKHKLGLGLAAADTAYDAYEGYNNAENWGTSKTAATIGGMIGGTGSGVSGAVNGALKGMALGATVGSAIPVVGTLIGGVIGALGGGIAGAIGGENIAKFLDSAWPTVKKIGSAIWDTLEKLLSYPKDFFVKIFDSIIEKKDDIWKKYVQPLMDTISNGITTVTEVFKTALDVLAHPIDSLKKLLGIKINPDDAKPKQESTISKYKNSYINSIANQDMDVIRAFESGGTVPKAAGGGVDGRGGQLAIVHEGEQIISKSVVESSKLSGTVPSGMRDGSVSPDLMSIISDKIDEALSGAKETASNVGGAFKAGFEKVKAALGPSSGFGWLSRMFESAGAGPGAIGWDGTGGWSYGSYQMAEKRGTLQRFFRDFPEVAKQFNGLNIGSDQFNSKWKSLASSDPGFAQSQHDFIKKQYLTPYMEKIKNMTGIDLSLKSPVISEEVLSTAVQYGPGSNVIPNALKGLNQSATDDAILRKIGEYKYNNVSSNFRSSSPAIQSSVANRIQREISIALGALGTGQGVAPSQLPKAATGGIITKEGPIYAHAGEVIGPINDVKESILGAMMSKKDIANMQTNGQINNANLLNGINNSASSFDGAGKQMVVMMNNFSNTMNSSLNNLSNAIMQGNKNNSASGNSINNILTGEVS